MGYGYSGCVSERSEHRAPSVEGRASIDITTPSPGYYSPVVPLLAPFASARNAAIPSAAMAACAPGLATARSGLGRGGKGAGIGGAGGSVGAAVVVMVRG